MVTTQDKDKTKALIVTKLKKKPIATTQKIQIVTKLKKLNL